MSESRRKCRTPIGNAPDECQLWTGHDGEHVGVNVSESGWCDLCHREKMICAHGPQVLRPDGIARLSGPSPAAPIACHPFDEPCDYGTGGPCRNHGGVVPSAARLAWPKPWECSSNALPDPSKACRRRIWLPLFWGGHCRRCMAEARSVCGG